MYEQELEFAKDTAKRAGKCLVYYFNKLSEIKSEFIDAKKGIKSEADDISDKLIREAIESTFPEHSIFSEESRKDLSNEYLWIVDPLDGTANFTRGIENFATSISLVHNGEIVVGVNYLPMQDEFFYSVKGEGAYCCKNYDFNKRKISVSEITSERIKEAYVHIDANADKFREGHEKIRNALYGFADKSKEANVGRIRATNAAVVELSWLADARIDACVYQGYAWDLAAGALLVVEAGGKVTDFQGNPWNIKCDSMIASNGKIHSRLEELLSKEFN